MKEQTFFSDPAIDRLMAATVSLAAELHVTRDRNRALEALLIEAGVVTKEAIEAWQPTAEEQEVADAERDLLVRNIFGGLTAPASAARGRNVMTVAVSPSRGAPRLS